MKFALFLATAIVLSSSCAARKTPGVYRLKGDLLIPPPYSKPAFRVPDVRGTKRSTECDLTSTFRLRWKGRDAVVSSPGGEPAAPEFARFRSRLTSMEEESCVAPGGSLVIVNALIERMALSPREAQELRYGSFRDTGFVDLEPGFRVRTIAPLLKGGGYQLKTAQETQSGNTLTIRTGSDFAGMETAIYSVVARPSTSGVRVDLVSVERMIDGERQPASAPVERFLDLPEWAGRIRLFLLTRAARSDNDVTIIGARSAALLDSATERFQVDPDNFCKAAPDGVVCRLVPAGIAVSPLVAVDVNGTAVYVPPGSTVRQAAPAGPATVHVLRRYGQQYLPVQPQAEEKLMDLVLVGGERISW